MLNKGAVLGLVVMFKTGFLMNQFIYELRCDLRFALVSSVKH